MLVGSLISFLAASFVPLWTVWSINRWEGVGHEGSLWFVLWELFRARFRAGNPEFPTTVTGDQYNLLFAAVAMLTGALIGAAHYKFRRILGKTPSEPPGN